MDLRVNRKRQVLHCKLINEIKNEIKLPITNISASDRRHDAAKVQGSDCGYGLSEVPGKDAGL